MSTIKTAATLNSDSMKRSVLLLSVALAVLCLFVPVAVQAAQTFTGKVIGVTDGDTITVLKGKTPVKVRLDGIDAPEEKQDFGTQAKKTASLLAFGKIVTVTVRQRDAYGRSVATVTLPGGVNLNQEMVRRGMAWWYRQYAPKDTTLAKLEQSANWASVGLWYHPNPTPPWDFRAGKPKAKATKRQYSAQPVANAPIVSAPGPSWQKIASWSGSSIKSTEKFTVGPEWKIRWATQPGNMGDSVFQIFIEGDDAGSSGVGANVIGAASDETYQHKAGTYYLTFNALQSYVVEVWDKR